MTELTNLGKLSLAPIFCCNNLHCPRNPVTLVLREDFLFTLASPLIAPHRQQHLRTFIVAISWHLHNFPQRTLGPLIMMMVPELLSAKC
jgi:hypothetical protein